MFYSGILRTFPGVSLQNITSAVADQARMLGSSVGKAGLEFRELARGGERNYSCSYLVRSIQRKTALYICSVL